MGSGLWSVADIPAALFLPVLNQVTSVALRVRNYAHVANYVMKLEHIGEASSDPIISAQLKVASGLMLLDRKVCDRTSCTSP
jgi:hypothetical protein